MESNLPSTVTATLVLTALLALGPRPSPAGVNEWIPRGPFGGTVWALAIDPQNPSFLFAGVQGSGVFRSIDGGATWSARNSGLGNLDVQALALDPTDPSTVYAGTVNGLFRSRDGGVSWSTTNVHGPADGPASSRDVVSLAVDPQRPNLVYAATRGGVFKTVDGGDSWSPSLPTGTVFAVAIDPRTTSTLYAAGGGLSHGLHKSVDGGNTWFASGSGLPADASPLSLAIDPENPSNLYLGTFNSGAFRSVDGAASWTAFGDGLPVRTEALVVVPGRPSTVYAGTSDGVYEIADGEVSWRLAGPELRRRQVLALAAVSAEPAVLFAGLAGGGVFESVDGGGSWSAVNHGISALTVSALEIDPEDPGRLFAATSGGLFRSADGGVTWESLDTGVDEVFFDVAVSLQGSSVVYAGSSCCVVRSVDGGDSWVNVSAGLRFPPVFSLELDSRSSSTLFAGLEGGVFKTVDGGVSWTHLSQGFFTNFVSDVVLDQEGFSTLFAAAGPVYRSPDGGASWTTSGNFDSAWSLAVDVLAPDVVYAAARDDGAFKTVDGGDSWFAINDGLPGPVNTVATAEPGIVYAGTEGHGVFVTFDGGGSWTALTRRGLSTPDIWSLEIARDGTVYAGSDGGGVFELASPCDDPGALCLNRERFLVEVEWRDFHGQTGAARTVPYRSDDSGMLWFFSAANWEMLVKVLDGCTFNGRFWVLAAATTNVEYTLRVTDTLTGDVNTYFNPLGQAAAATVDGNAFATCSVPPGGPASAAPVSRFTRLRPPPGDVAALETATAPEPCAPSATQLCLQRERFRVEVEWRDFSGKTGPGQAVPFSSDDSGLLWFFSADNWEMLVKVLDGCGLNHRFWVFAAATTNVEYTLRVTDTLTGDVRSYRNPLGRAAAAVTDANAFDTCDR